MSPTDFSAILSNSLSLSSILILTALGLAITFGVMRVINMAHGEMLMLGAYTAFVVTDVRYLGLNLFWAMPASFLAVGLVGYLLEVSLIRFLYGRPLDTLLATWAVGLILQQVVKLWFGANLQPMRLPEMLQGGLTFGQVTIPLYRLFIVGVTLLCLAGVYVWFFKTAFGLRIRAVVQNRAMAAALGISTRRVDSLTFAFACGLAGLAGCILAHLYNVKYNMGSDYVVEAFMVVILGGMGQLAGSVAGGVLMGASNGVVAKVITSAWVIALALGLGVSRDTLTKMVGENSESMAKVVVLLVVIGLVLARPSGLFTRRERTYD
jgi:urea transport system permease protein